MKLELTQFSRIEFAASGIIGTPAEALQAQLTSELSARPKAMCAFELAMRTEGEQRRIERLGGFGNLQRIRVFKDGDAYSFEYTTALPPHVLEQKRREQERKEAAEKARQAREEQILAAVTLVVAANIQASARKIREQVKPETPKQKKQRHSERKKFLLSKQGEKAAFDAAWQQRRNEKKFNPSKKDVPVEKVKRLPQFRGL